MNARPRLTVLSPPEADERLTRGWQAALSVAYPVVATIIALSASRRILSGQGSSPICVFLCATLWLSLAAGCVAMAALRGGGVFTWTAVLVAGGFLVSATLSAITSSGLTWAVIPAALTCLFAVRAYLTSDERLRMAATTALSWAIAVLAEPVIILYALGLIRNHDFLARADVYLAIPIGCAVRNLGWSSGRWH